MCATYLKRQLGSAKSLLSFFCFEYICENSYMAHLKHMVGCELHWLVYGIMNRTIFFFFEFFLTIRGCICSRNSQIRPHAIKTTIILPFILPNSNKSTVHVPFHK